MPRVPASESELTAAWLSDALGVRCRSVELERIGEGFGLASRIFRCRLAGQAPASVVVKLWDTTGPGGAREVSFFRSFGGKVGVRTPACYHAAVDHLTGRGALVLQDLGRVEQGDCLRELSLDRARAVADVLAALHAKWRGSPALDAAEWLPLAPRMQRTPDWIAARRTRFVERFDDWLDDFSRRLLRDAEAAYDRGIGRLAGVPHTLLHADLHLDNFVFDPATGEPILLDWARCARGPGLLDLASLVFHMVEPDALEGTVAAYLVALQRRGVHHLDLQLLLRRLGGALLLTFITSTCGIARWEPEGERGACVIDSGIHRAIRAVSYWRARDPELFRF